GAEDPGRRLEEPASGPHPVNDHDRRHVTSAGPRTGAAVPATSASSLSRVPSAPPFTAFDTGLSGSPRSMRAGAGRVKATDPRARRERTGGPNAPKNTRDVVAPGEVVQPPARR